MAKYGMTKHFTGIVCETPDEVDNGTLSLPTDNTYGAVYSIACDSGYYLIGVVNRTCQSDGTWSGGVPVCLGESTQTCNNFQSALILNVTITTRWFGSVESE